MAGLLAGSASDARLRISPDANRLFENDMRTLPDGNAGIGHANSADF
jgi:hypothetical protein